MPNWVPMGAGRVLSPWSGAGLSQHFFRYLRYFPTLGFMNATISVMLSDLMTFVGVCSLLLGTQGPLKTSWGIL